MTQEGPAGFEPMSFDPVANFVGANGPLCCRIGADGLQLGFRVAPHHCNLAMVCHGGMLATLADMQLSLGARYAADLEFMLPTVSLSIDFVRPVELGAWIQGMTDLLDVKKNLVFAQTVLTVRGVVCVRASAILKISTKSLTSSEVSTALGRLASI